MNTNTAKAYAADWAHFTRWCRLNAVDPLPPCPEMISRYLTDLAFPRTDITPLSVRSIERKLSGLKWNYSQRGFSLDRQDHRISNALSRTRNSQAPTRAPKDHISHDDIQAMVNTLPHDRRGLRDRAILLLGYSARLKPSELVGLNIGNDQTADCLGWIDVFETEIRLSLRSKTGLREINVLSESNAQSCPVHAVGQWMTFANIQTGPLFVRIARDGKRILKDRLSTNHVTRLIKSTLLNSNLRNDLPEAGRLARFSGQSLCSRGMKAAREIEREL